MSARILIVDHDPKQLHLLEACLMAEKYQVLTATSGEGAINICQRGQCDLVLLQMMDDDAETAANTHANVHAPMMQQSIPQLPKANKTMDAIEICVRLKFQQDTSHIPLLMIARHDDYTRRAQGIAAGVDDFIYYPVDGLELSARVNSLVNLKRLMDEVEALGGTSLDGGQAIVHQNCSNILIAGPKSREQSRVAEQLSLFHHVKIEHDPEQLLLEASSQNYDVLLLASDYYDPRYETDAVHFITQLRALNRTNGLAILMTAHHHEGTTVSRALSAGADDYLMLPLDRSILSARIHTQVLMKGMRKKLSAQVEAQLEHYSAL